MNADMAKQLGLSEVKGLYVGRVVPDCAAEKAGLQKGDILLSVAGVQVNSFAEMMEELGRYNPGDLINVTYYRNGETHAVTVVLHNSQGTTEIVRKR